MKGKIICVTPSGMITKFDVDVELVDNVYRSIGWPTYDNQPFRFDLNMNEIVSNPLSHGYIRTLVLEKEKE